MMTPVRNFCVLAVSVVTLSSLGRSQTQTGQTQSPPGASDTTIKSTSEEVVLDLVVRDKKGHTIADLKKEDFQVSDNGQNFPIQSFRRVEGQEVLSSAGQRTQLDPLRQIRLLSLVFERLDMNGRQLARSAALDLLKAELPQNVFVAVMAIDQRLEVLQHFTNDRSLLRKSIERATSGETEFAGDTARVQQQVQNMVGPNTSGAQTVGDQVAAMSDGGSGNGPASAPTGGGAANKAMAQLMLDMLDFSRRGEETQTGRASIFALLALVRDQYRLPGRKTVLYFSEGFSVPQGAEEAFKSVMSTANRSNVSFYALDARGLTSASLSGAQNSDMASAASASRSQTTQLRGAVTSQQARAMDTAIEGSRANTQTTLATLAESTGGSLIANTNDFRTALRRVTEDIESYYVLTYTPNIQNYNGQFRKVGVRVDRADARVQSRDGYFALPPNLTHGNVGLASYEMPLLSALDAPAPKRDFPHSASGMHFFAANKPEFAVVIDVPLSDVALNKDAASGRLKGQFSYVALVKDQSGAVVKKFSGEQPVNIPADKLTATQASHFIYDQHTDLAPGRYRLDTAVMDMTAGKISTRKASFLMPAADGRLAISSVAIVRSVRDKSADATDADPFVMGDKVVTP